MAGKTRTSVKTKKLRGKAIVRGAAGTATRTVGLLGGILTYAVEAGIMKPIRPMASASRKITCESVGYQRRSTEYSV
ncbi:hypothetical protein [Bradyrhizobium sp. 180]|uniref:hypothetical protein n=1 Tax=Bradyrhizobium sp. 180 TaxID=2782650 RepID=UPI0021131EE9|nr:hypothetical protein [Bradyrhizobium sp. 180]